MKKRHTISKRALARDGCVFSRCSSESEVRIWYLFWKKHCQKRIKWWHFFAEATLRNVILSWNLSTNDVTSKPHSHGTTQSTPGQEGSETYLFFQKIKRVFATAHRPGLDAPNASRWYGRLRVQKSILSVLICAHLPGQSFHVRHFLDRSAPSPYQSWITSLFPGCSCFSLKFPTNGFVLLTSTACSREDETRNGQRNANRNPEWWGDFSQLVKIEKLKFLGISRYKFELRFWLNLNAFVSHGTTSNWDFGLIWMYNWLKSHHHSGFRFAFRWPFRVPSSR